MEEEATEDFYKFAGSSEHERDVAENEKSTLFEQVKSCVRGRVFWLGFTAVLSFIAVYVFSKFEPLIDKNTLTLIFFTPLVIAVGGNVGSQSSAVTIINLTSKDKEVDRITVLKEIISGSINGIIISIVVGLIASIFERNLMISLVVSLTTFINMFLGATLGTMIPIVLDRLKFDPSAISSPIISSVMDVIGMLVYLILISIVV